MNQMLCHSGVPCAPVACSSRRCKPSHVSHIPVMKDAQQLHARQNHVSSRPTALHSQTTGNAALQPHTQRWRTLAAAQETIELSDPVIEYMGLLNDGMQTVKGVIHVAADADLVYNILTDYDSCGRVFRNVAGSQTLYTPSGQKQVVQACKWNFFTFSGTFNVTLNVEEDPTSRLLVFRLHESSFMRDFEGRWQVEPVAGGSCRIEHVLAVKPVMSIPAAIAPYTSTIFKGQVGILLQDLQQEIAQQTAAQAADN